MKIAICVSGQTRRHNDYSNEWFGTITELFGDYDYDLFGHTWSDQPTPITKSKFKKFTVDDQIMMEKWIEEDPQQRLYHNIGWIQHKDYHIKLKDGSWYEHAIGATKRAYGQFWSALLCYELVNSDYDLIVRYRWDIGLKENKEQVKRAIHNFSKAQNLTSALPGQIDRNIEPMINTDVLVSTPSRSDYIEDLFFVSNSNILKCKYKPIGHWMDEMMKIQYPEKPVAHKGWASLLKALQLNIVTNMPNAHHNLDHKRMNSENASGNLYYPKDEF